MTNQEHNQDQILIEDLTITEITQSEIKGGPAFMKLGDIKGEVAAAQTREHILLARQTN